MNREQSLAQLQAQKKFDVLIIGGGATGLGAAVEAASRGYTTALVEAHDFAKGTSSRSTKLVHGGVRYLAQGNIGLVREALRERGLLRQNAPHLVHGLEFVVPAFDWWAGPYYGIGLKIYDVLAGKLNLGTSKLISRDEALARIPTLEPSGLQGGVVYYDGQFDDARLAITLARTANDLGAVLLNHAPVQSLLHENARVVGVVVQDSETGQALEVQAKVVINATGVFADRIRKMDDAESRPMLSPSQGVHLVLPKEFLPGNTALMVPRTDDGRVLFVVPWHDRAVVGTTDTAVANEEFEPKPQEQEINFLLEHAARYLSKDPSNQDVLATYTGLRPLVKNDAETGTAALSRDHNISISQKGLVTIVGGKWTTYRKMGQDVIDKATNVGDLEIKESRTANLRLRGANETEIKNQTNNENSKENPLAIYGTDAKEIQNLMQTQPELAATLHPRLPYNKAQIVYAARFEMARTLEDVLSRRTRALLLDARASLEAAPETARLMAQELGRGATWEETQFNEYRERVQASVLP